jgi:subtilisin family serine protease
MKRAFRSRTRIAALALAAAVGTAVLPVAAGGSVGASGPTASYIVTFRDGTNPFAEARGLRSAGWRVGHVYSKIMSGVAVELPPAVARALARNPHIASVELDGVATVAATQNSATWGLDRSDQRARPLDGRFSYPDSAGAGVRVYVVDTGVRASHVDLAGRVAPGATAINDGRGTDDCNGHGTHVAGTAAGTNWGLAKQATIVPVRVLDCSGAGSWSGIIAGLDWIAANNGGVPAVANLSLGGGANSSVDAAVSRLHNSGVTVVVAAGNSNANACNYSPARAPVAVTVGSTTSSDARSSFSNFGTCLDLFAPGSSITSAWHTSNTATTSISGTSMASPHVAGAAALVLGQRPTLTPNEVTQVIVSGATTGVVSSRGTGSPNRLLYSDPTNLTPPALAVTTSSLPVGTVGEAWSAQLAAENGTAPYTWSIDGDAGWLSVDGSSLVGSPTAAGTTNITVRVTDSVGGTATADVSVTVAESVSVTTSSLSGATAGTAYSTTLAATGGTGTYTWALASGSLPAGLSLSAAGTISGTPTTGGTSSFTVRATDGAARTATASLSIDVTVPALPAPGAFGKSSPTNGRTGVSRSSVSLTWQASTNAASYEVCVSTTPSCPGAWTSTGTNRSFTVRSMARRTTYYWQVRAVNTSGLTEANTGTWWRYTTG